MGLVIIGHRAPQVLISKIYCINVFLAWRNFTLVLEYIEADSFEVQTLHVYEKQIPHKIHLCNMTSTAVRKGLFVIIQYHICCTLCHNGANQTVRVAFCDVAGSTHGDSLISSFLDFSLH